MTKDCHPLLIPVFCLALAFAAQTAAAQSEESQEAEKVEEGQVMGKVTVDEEPYEGAGVVLKGLDSEERCETKTDQDGEYSCRVPGGRYELSISIEGRRIGRREVEVKGGMGNQMDIPLTSEMLEQVKKGQDLQARFSEAIELNKAGNYEQAVPILEELATEVPEEWAIQAQLAVAYDELNRLEKATTHYEKAVELQPDNYALHMNLGGVYAKQHRVEEAKQEYETVAKLQPDQAGTAYFNLGVTLYNNNQLKAAIEPFRKATELDPDRAIAFYLLGVCLFNNAKTKVEDGEVKTVLLPGTQESFERYLELEPNGQFAKDARDMLQAIEATAPASGSAKD